VVVNTRITGEHLLINLLANESKIIVEPEIKSLTK
jgi:hypothetical protein